MIKVRKAKERGHFNFGWLDTHHTFSFGDYQNSNYMGFRNLRVINEDRIQPGKGFGTHSHRNMEIISYVVQGALAHKDSMGNGSSIMPGEVQYMSAGSGVTHSEFNHSKEEATHFLQIWIVPDREDTDPRYAQKTVALAQKKNRLYRVVGPDGSNAPIEIYQDVTMYASVLDASNTLEHALPSGRCAWVQVIRGRLSANQTELQAGDGLAIEEEAKIMIQSHSDAEFLLFDLN